MIYYFKNNKLIMSTSDGLVPSEYDFMKENLTDEQLDKVSQGYIFSTDEEGNEILVAPEGRKEQQDAKLAQKKKQEAQNIILERYPLRKQININRLGGKEAEEMNARIDAIREEENKNGKDADFTKFLS